MNYEQFKKEYTQAFQNMTKYNTDQIGSSYFAEKMADLADLYPDFEKTLLEEI